MDIGLFEDTVPLTLFDRCCCRLSSLTSRVDIRAGKLEGSMRSIGIEPRSGLELVGNIGLWTTIVSFVVARGAPLEPALAIVVIVVVVVAVVVADVSDGCTLMSTLHCTFP